MAQKVHIVSYTQDKPRFHLNRYGTVMSLAD